MYTHLLLRELQNYNSLLNNHGQENVGSHQKKIFHVQGQRGSPRKTVGEVKSHLESSSIPTRDTQRAQTNLVCTRTQRPQETETVLCLSVSCGGTGQQGPATRAGALGAVDQGMT